MRMKAKSIVFFISYLLGGLVVMLVGFSLYSDSVAIVVVLSWFLAFGIGQLFLLRCPHCRKSAIITPRWAATPFVGERCQHCGKEY